jgi:hypothetical protein
MRLGAYGGCYENLKIFPFFIIVYMEGIILYGQEFELDDGAKNLYVWDGIHQTMSTHGNKIYPTLRMLGFISINNRKFYKFPKRNRKIFHQQNDTVIMSKETDPEIREMYTCRELTNFLIEKQYSEGFINDIRNIVITQSNNPNLKTNNHNRDGGEHEGIVEF